MVDLTGRPLRVPADVLVTMTESCLIIGGPGTGKSSLLRIATTNAAQGWLSGEPPASGIPVRVPAADLTRGTIPEALAARATEDLGAVGCHQTWPADFFASAPIRGVRWTVLVDGLDELVDPAGRRTVLAKIAGSERAAHRFVVASRPLPDAELDRGAWPPSARFRLLTFTGVDLEEFAARWFPYLGLEDPDMAAALFVRRLRPTALVELARTPLMATLLCQLFAAEPDRPLPLRRFDVYQRYVALLVERQFSTGPAGMTAQTQVALSRFPGAVTAAETVLRDLHYQAAFNALRDWPLACLGPRPDPAAARPEAVPESWWDDFLQQAERRSGLIVQRGRHLVFAHPTLAEFLAAESITARESSSNAAFAMAFDRMWRWDWGERRRRWHPTAPESALGFLIAGWTAAPHPGLHRALSRILRRGGLRGWRFIADRVAETTPVPPDIVEAARDRLAATARRPQQSWTSARTQIEAAKVLARLDLQQARDLLHLQAWRLATDDQRLDAATELAGLGDPRGNDLLAGWAIHARWARHRERAAAELARLNDARYPEVLVRLAFERTADVSTRYQAALKLVRQGDQAGLRALNALAFDPAVSSTSRHWAAIELDERGARWSADALHAFAVTNPSTVPRLWAAGKLMLLGDPRGADHLRALADDQGVPLLTRQGAAFELILADHTFGHDPQVQALALAWGRSQERRVLRRR